MFVGAYWSVRDESKEQAATRIGRFLAAIAPADERLRTWFRKGESRSEANTPLEIGSALVAVPPVGFSLAAWNGGDVSFTVAIGSTNSRAGNSAVVSFGPKADVSCVRWEPILTAAIDAFDPDHAVVTSNALLDRVRAQRPWEAGLITYARGGVLTAHPENA